MYHILMGPTYEAMRKQAKLEPEDVGDAIGRSARTILRLEANDSKVVLKREHEEKIFEVTQTSKLRFGSIASEHLGAYIGRRIVILPPDALIPAIDLLGAYKYFSRHSYKLPLDEYEEMQEMLDSAREDDFRAERLCRSVARSVVRRVDKARKSLGEDPSKDPADRPWIDEKTLRMLS